jgi:hypothetical protein
VCGLTPELSRTDLRRGGVVHVTAQAEPRSGLGLNELLGVPFMERQLSGPRPRLPQVPQEYAEDSPHALGLRPGPQLIHAL